MPGGSKRRSRAQAAPASALGLPPAILVPPGTCAYGNPLLQETPILAISPQQRMISVHEFCAALAQTWIPAPHPGHQEKRHWAAGLSGWPRSAVRGATAGSGLAAAAQPPCPRLRLRRLAARQAAGCAPGPSAPRTALSGMQISGCCTVQNNARLGLLASLPDSFLQILWLKLWGTHADAVDELQTAICVRAETTMQLMHVRMPGVGERR